MGTTAWMWVAWAGMAGIAGGYGWLWRKAGEKGRIWLEWGLVVFVAAVSAVSVLTHEPWRDETHAWLLAREWNVRELFGQMHYEGHFAPWHLMLHLPARAGLPVESMGWLAWAINAAMVAWFVRKAPLGGWAKACVALSCGILYVNPVISRCYVLVPPVLFGLAALWQKRDEWPIVFGLLVALLANTHLCMEGTAGLLFLAYAWQNVFGRSDGKKWRACGLQLVGLGVMGAGICVAMAQLVPVLWDPGICFTDNAFGWARNATWFFEGVTPWIGVVGVVAGLAWLGREAWRRDRGLFAVYAGSLAYMVGLSVFLYPAFVINRALMWWPVALGVAWALGAGGTAERRKWLTVAVAVAGMGLMRPDMTWRDWREDYDGLQPACGFIAEKYGRDAEVWVNGGDLSSEVASAYLDNVMDWRTGRRAERFSMALAAQRPAKAFREFLDVHFANHPEAESVLVLGTTATWGGLTPEDVAQPETTVEYVSQYPLCPWSPGVFAMRVERGNPADRAAFWVRAGTELAEQGEWGRAVAAWKLASRLDGRQWEAMNNLAWVFAQTGHAEEAREWIDRALEIPEARNRAEVRDTVEAVRRAEGESAARNGE